MADDDTPAGTTGASGSCAATSAGPDGADRSRRSGWILPLIALLLGLALGAGIMALVGRDDGPAEQADGATPTATATVTPTPTRGTVGQVVVPQTCLQIADEGHRLSVVLGDGVTAAQKLDALAMSSVVRDIGTIQTRLEGLAQNCRRGAGATSRPLTESPSVTPEPSSPAE